VEDHSVAPIEYKISNPLLPSPFKSKSQSSLVYSKLSLFPILIQLRGEAIECIGEFMGEDIPLLALCSKQILKNFLVYQEENLDIQEYLITEQIDELKQ